MRPDRYPCGDLQPHGEHQHTDGPDAYYYLCPGIKTEDGDVTPPAAPTTTPAPTGGELAAESATGASTPEAAPSSHAARQEAGLEGNGGDGDDEGVGTG